MSLSPAPRDGPALHADDLARGALYMVGSALLFAGMGLMVKLASRSLPNVVVVFIRSLISLLAVLPWVLRHGRGGLRTRHFTEHLVRGVFGLAVMYCFFFALAHMRLADAVLLNYSVPLFIPLVESAWLGEPFPARLWGPILLGFLGIVVVLRPGPGLFEPVALIGLSSACFAAIAQVGVRRLTRTEPVVRILFYFGLVSTVLSAIPAWRFWRSPSGSVWLILLALGVLATAGQLFLTRAYAHAPASRVGPFIYTAVIFAGLIDWLFFAKLPDAFSVAGTALVAAAGILTLRKEPTPLA
jgi:drug/metabolite transporter (DMT)-like permease